MHQEWKTNDSNNLLNYISQILKNSWPSRIPKLPLKTVKQSFFPFQYSTTYAIAKEYVDHITKGKQRIAFTNALNTTNSL